jgi:hypothetical protein
VSEYIAETRFKLEEAKFFYEQMKLNLQERTKFRYYLDALLASARAVTHVFQKGRGKTSNSLMEWYDSKVNEWNDKPIMRFFIELRNTSLKEHTPRMQTTATLGFSFDVILVDSLAVKKVSPEGPVQQVGSSPSKTDEAESKKQETASTKPRVVIYSFNELPSGFSQDPEVMALCQKYLKILESFVKEAESKV